MVSLDIRRVTPLEQFRLCDVRCRCRLSAPSARSTKARVSVPVEPGLSHFGTGMILPAPTPCFRSIQPSRKKTSKVGGPPPAVPTLGPFLVYAGANFDDRLAI